MLFFFYVSQTWPGLVCGGKKKQKLQNILLCKAGISCFTFHFFKLWYSEWKGLTIKKMIISLERYIWYTSLMKWPYIWQFSNKSQPYNLLIHLELRVFFILLEFLRKALPSLNEGGSSCLHIPRYFKKWQTKRCFVVCFSITSIKKVISSW